VKIWSLRLSLVALLAVFFCTSVLAKEDPLEGKLHKRNVALSGYWGRKVSKELQIEGRVEYVLQGKVPLGFLPLNFLFDNLPLTARMVNAYQATDYKIKYLHADRRSFLATIKGLRGRMNLLSPPQQTSKRVYYGDGQGKFLCWQLYGTVLVLVDIRSLDGQNCAYDLRIYLFNESSFVNGLLSLGVVRWAIKGRIRKILGHIVESALQFRQDQTQNQGKGEFLQDYKLFKGAREREFLREFLRLDSLSQQG